MASSGQVAGSGSLMLNPSISVAPKISARWASMRTRARAPRWVVRDEREDGRGDRAHLPEYDATEICERPEAERRQIERVDVTTERYLVEHIE